MLSCLWLVANCASVEPPLGQGAGYPPTWPGFASLDAECLELTGRYLDKGIAVGSDGVIRSVSLASLLLTKPPANLDALSLEVVTKKRGKGGGGFARLIVSLGGEDAAMEELSNCFCIDAWLYCPNLRSTGFGGPGLAAGQQNVWLVTDLEGALLAKIGNYRTGIILLMPFYSGGDDWARFAPSIDSRLT